MMQATLTRNGAETPKTTTDMGLLSVTVVLLALGLLMVASASVSIAEKQFGDPLHYFIRQGAYVGLGLIGMLVAYQISIETWQRTYPLLLVCGLVLLVLVLVPGIGKAVNGSVRWLSVGPFNFQPSELMKLVTIIFCAGYVEAKHEQLRANIGGLLRPLFLVGVIGVLLLVEPDFGATVVTMATAMGILFLGGCRLGHITAVGFAGLVGAALLIMSSEYRMARFTAFLDPWGDPFDSGFQLTQALIAFGRGEWFGVGLGASVQKLFYLPEAHTDFLFAVIAEELGVLGTVVSILLFSYLIWRAFRIGVAAEENGSIFASLLCYGIGIWFALQVFINIGVNMGLLPTKGLTLPLMSYGGSSMLTMCFAIGLLLRVAAENRKKPMSHRSEVMQWVNA